MQIKETGYVKINYFDNSKEISINYSSILTKLIQEVGRLTDHYASDLFIEWKYLIEKPIEEGTIDTINYEILIREMGVCFTDKADEEYLKQRRECWESETRMTMDLDVVVTDKTIEMTLSYRER